MSVSVVLYGRDGARHLADALRSIEHQDVAVEVIMADGGSRDRSVEVGQASPLGVRVLECSREETLPELAAAGAVAAQGQRVCFLAYDDALAPGVLPEVLAVDADVVVCDAIRQDGFRRSVERAPLGIRGTSLPALDLVAASPEVTLARHLAPSTAVVSRRLRPAGLLSFRAGTTAAAWRAWAWDVLCADVMLHYLPRVLTYVRAPAEADAEEAQVAGALAALAGVARGRPGSRAAARVVRAALQPLLAREPPPPMVDEARRLLREVPAGAVAAAADTLPRARRTALLRLAGGRS